ncbi:GIY-YIG nuclease family protein [Pseudidiomarina sp. GXY010]|uniref:GIY-YIG nuclease family protein n=1 Tax=Pseudidiomarina fusca TaxID=2965078 RepID=A0ABU3KW15_9GAMM|nr:GIY-YIG nuclease family protein [Pseudidiomarina sp. GXY010]MDT7525118.1 GIY-YIG nuclease family protein [Pseudidiomarina sp. GXY010]
MHPVFKEYIDSLEPSFQQLLNMKQVTVATLPKEIPQSGIYLFSENGKHLYVGRTNTIRKRLQNHCRPSSGHNSATFAFRLTREITGITQATYVTDGSRANLELDATFGPEFIKQKKRVREMHVRYVSEPEPMRQALLEMYVSVSLGTPHNNFDNH